MADERRTLDALERMRLHTGDRDTSLIYSDGTQHFSHALDAALAASPLLVTDTPTRRKSSALSISHLTTATPIRSTVRGTNTNNNSGMKDTNALTSQAVRDIARELDVVEAQLSVYRQSREAPTKPIEEGNELSSTPPPPLPHLEPPVSIVSGALSSLYELPRGRPQRTQQAGEVADEVDHALANCDRLLQQAQLQASAASLSRSLRTSSGARPSSSTTRSNHPNASRSTSSPMLYVDSDRDLLDRRPPPPPQQPSLLPSSSKRVSPSTSYSSSSLPVAEEEDAIQLQATARTMRAFTASCEAEMEREGDVIAEQSKLTQAAQLKDLQRKYASKKKLVLIAIREKCETETRAQVKQAVATYEQEQLDAVKSVEAKLLQDRERVLDQILANHQADTEDHVKRVRVRIQGETLVKKQQLEAQLQHELDDQLRQIDHDTQVEMQRFEQKKRLEMESNVFTRREQAATSILKAQEAKTSELKQQLHRQHTQNEHDELGKLHKALAFGAQAQLQQLKKQLDAQHEQRLADTRTEASLALEAKLSDLKQVLVLAHEQEMQKVQRELDKRQRIAVMELHEKLENTHRQQIDAMTTTNTNELENLLATQRKKLANDNLSKLEKFQQILERDAFVKHQELEREMERQCEQALEMLRTRHVEAAQRELEAKMARMQHSKAKLLDEAMLLLTVAKPSPSAEQGVKKMTTTQTTLQLEHLSQQLPKELQRVVGTLVRDFDELVEQQTVLVEKISESTGLYLSFKRQCAQWQQDVDELKQLVEKLQAQLQQKDALAKKLYMANDALLKKLGLDGSSSS